MYKKSRAVCAVVAAVSMFSGIVCENTTTYSAGEERNLSYRRAMYQSSSYNCNETAQLAADGIIGNDEDELNMAYTFEHEHGNESRYGNVQYLFDRDTSTNWETYHKSAWVSVCLPRKTVIKSYTLASGQADWSTQLYAAGWTLEGSLDGKNWDEIDTRSSQSFAYNGEEQSFEIPENETAYLRYRLKMTAKTDRIYMSEWNMYDENNEPVLASYNDNVFEFTSVWMSETNSDEWIYSDLGGESEINGVNIYWGSSYADNYEIQISDDAENWRTVAAETNGAGGMEEIKFSSPESGRYVKLQCNTAADSDAVGFIVKEFEVLGTNEVNYTGEADKEPEEREDGTTVLSGGNWRVERESLVEGGGEEISTGDYDSSSWLPAIVPGTVLTSYKRAGAVPDPNYADQQKLISDSYFKSNFWYRNSFTVPQDREGKKVCLNFQAINWKADVYLNGSFIGDINGAFTRAGFDITDYVNYGGENYLAVLIHCNTDPGTAYISNDAHPGTMGGVFGNSGSIGRDAPTYSAAAGWDWVPTIRGRNIGIYNEVTLSYSGAAQLVDPWVVTKFERENSTPTQPVDSEWIGDEEIFNVDGSTLDLTRAKLTLKTEVKNTSGSEITANVKGVIAERPDIVFEKSVSVAANSSADVIFDTAIMDDPEIWWPNTYGEQPLYTMNMTVETNGVVSDEKSFQFGVREITYNREKTDESDRNGYRNGDKLTIYCNGTRIIVRGGNWGLEDQDLDVNAEKYDEKIRLQKENNFNMIRNWGGQTNDPEFYNACDRYGIIVWDDFFLPGCWLHHPRDIDMFLANAVDKVKNYRYHPSLVMYCGANEMWPESDDYINNAGQNTIEAGLRRIVDEYDGTRTYIPNSAEKPVAVDGPHQAKTPTFYFTNSVPGMMNSERGLPNIPVKETMLKIFPEENLWPQNDMWALHDFAMQWNVNGADYMKALRNYGDYDSFEGFVSRAQMQGYEIHKAMFESVYAVNTNGLLMWMSNPAWTSLMWQSYDYYHDGNGGYYGAKTANQPVNYIWNPSDNTMVLHNSTPEEKELTASVDVFDIDGKLLYNNTQTKTLASDTSEIVTTLSFPSGASALKFIRTTVKNELGETVGRDFYWHNTRSYDEYPNYQDYSDMADMNKAEISAEYIHTGDDGAEEQYPYKHYKILLKNTGDTPAIMLRLKVMKRSDNERVLPVYYEDNYFSLMPGETREVWAEFKQSSLGDDEPVFMVEGWNVDEQEFGEENQTYVSAVNIERLSQSNEGVMTDGSYTGHVDITAASDTAIDGKVMLGFYRAGRLEKTVVKELPAQVAEGTTTVSTDALTLDEGDYNDCEIRGYVWSSDMEPYADAAILKNAEMLPPTYVNRNMAPEALSVKASSEEASNPAKNATDGNTGSRWASSSEDDNWLLVDLGEEKTITSFVIRWEAAYASSYKIEVSSDGENFTEAVRKDNGNGGTESFSFEPIRARYVRWVGEKRATGWGYSMYEFEINNNVEPNLAVGAAVSASSSESGYDAQKLTDGDLSSRWVSRYDTSSMSESEKNDQWVVIDLGEEKTFRTMYLVWESAYGKVYDISVSSDGENYTQVYTESNGTSGTKRYVLDETVNARYVKLKLNQRGTGWGYSLYEVMIYR
ncbi:MAG: discoidin domain-containing protein [bacterium]|nr:discoidin domain-containing protein [bacterium]